MIGGGLDVDCAKAERRRGWALLETIPVDAVASYQPYWALLAHLLPAPANARIQGSGCPYGRAAGLCEDCVMREFLQRQIAPQF
jgi:hypothetical protein